MIFGVTQATFRLKTASLALADIRHRELERSQVPHTRSLAEYRSLKSRNKQTASRRPSFQHLCWLVQLNQQPIPRSLLDSSKAPRLQARGFGCQYLVTLTGKNTYCGTMTFGNLVYGVSHKLRRISFQTWGVRGDSTSAFP